MGAVHVRTPKNFVLEAPGATPMRLRRTPRPMPEIGARPVRPQSTSPSNTFTRILAVARNVPCRARGPRAKHALYRYGPGPSASPMPHRKSASRN